MCCPGAGHRAATRPRLAPREQERQAGVVPHRSEGTMLHPLVLALTNFLLLRLQGGGSGWQILVLTVQFGTLPVLTLDLLGILLVLLIALVAAVLVGFFTGGPRR